MRLLTSRLSPLIGSTLRRLYSLQGRLLVGLVTTWLAIVGLLLVLAWLFGKDLVEDANVAHLRYESQLIADGLTENVNRRLAALERLASRLETHESGELKSLLEDNQALMEWFEGIMVTGPEGRVLADWPVVEGRVGLETASTEYFRMVRHSPWPYVSQPFVGRASGDPLVLMLVPRLGERGEFLGVVGGMVNLAQGGLFGAWRLSGWGRGAMSRCSRHPAKCCFIRVGT